MDFGEILSKSWKEYKSNFKVFLIIFLLLSVIPSIILYFISLPYNLQILKLGTSPSLSELLGIIFNLRYLLPMIIFFVVEFMLGLFMSTSFIYNSLYRKKEMNVRETLLGGKKYFWRFFWFSIVYGIFLIGLFLLLIIPGVIFLVFWTFSSYILIGENKGILESLKTSRKLVKGKWWRTFGFILLFVLITIAISLGFSIIAGLINWIIGLPFLIKGFSKITIETIKTGALQIPVYVTIITGTISQIFNLGAKLITIPLSIFFFKNFYFEMRKNMEKR